MLFFFPESSGSSEQNLWHFNTEYSCSFQWPIFVFAASVEGCMFVVCDVESVEGCRFVVCDVESVEGCKFVVCAVESVEGCRFVVCDVESVEVYSL